MAAAADKSKPYIPLAGSASDGWSKDDEASATCFCGAVQLAFVSLSLEPRRCSSTSSRLASGLPHPLAVCTNTIFNQPTQGPGLIGTFVCNCADCRKLTASMFASNFTVASTHLTHVRGQENLSTFSQSKTVASHNVMTNYFCKTCGTLMYRVSSGFPGFSVLRIGTIDDFNLQETKLKPQVEQFTKDRVAWLGVVQGARQVEGSYF
jgi:hypothetical protein